MAALFICNSVVTSTKSCLLKTLTVVDDYEPEAAADSSYGHGESHYGGDDHVDYGAYTGGYGAFGW